MKGRNGEVTERKRSAQLLKLLRLYADQLLEITIAGERIITNWFPKENGNLMGTALPAII